MAAVDLSHALSNLTLSVPSKDNEQSSLKVVSKQDDIVHVIKTISNWNPDCLTPLPDAVFVAKGLFENKEADIKLEYVTVSVIKDGSSFLHCLLKMTKPGYNKVSENDRKQLARDLRTSLANILDKPNKTNYSEADALKTIFKDVDPRKDTELKIPINSYYFTIAKTRNEFKEQPLASKDFEQIRLQIAGTDEYNSDIFSFVVDIIFVNINIYRLVDNKITLVRSYMSNPPKSMLRQSIESTGSETKLVWSRPLLAILHKEDNTYEPIGYRTNRGPIRFKFSVEGRIY